MSSVAGNEFSCCFFFFLFQVLYISCITYLMNPYSPQAEVILPRHIIEHSNISRPPPLNNTEFIKADYLIGNIFIETNKEALRIIKQNNEMLRRKRFISNIRPYLPNERYFRYKIFDIVIPIILEFITNATLS